MLDTIVLIKVSLNLVRGTRVIVWKPNFLQTIDPCNTTTNKKLYALSAKHIPTRNLTDPKSAHTLQVITAELLTKYKVIMFSSIGEMCEEKFQVHSTYNVLKISNIGKQEIGIWQFRKVLTRYNSLLANCWPNMKPFCLVVIETIVTKIFVGRTDGRTDKVNAIYPHSYHSYSDQSGGIIICGYINFSETFGKDTLHLYIIW